MDFSDNDVENTPVKASPKSGGNTTTVPLKSSIKVRLYSNTLYIIVELADTSSIKIFRHTIKNSRRFSDLLITLQKNIKV